MIRKKNKNTVEQTENAAADMTAQPEAAAQQAAETAPVAEAEANSEGAAAQENTEIALLKDRYARLMADFDNFRKRQVRERSDLIKRANEDLLKDMLPVLDHLELAMAQADDLEAPFVVGVKMVFDQFYAVLQRHGMQPVDAAGEEFDPTYHEALSQMPSDSIPANTVLEQFRRGWLLNGHLVRPAQVVVSAGAPTEAEQPAATSEAETEA